MIVLKSHSSHCFELLFKYELYVRASVSLPQLLLQLIDTQGERERERESLFVFRGLVLDEHNVVYVVLVIKGK